MLESAKKLRDTYKITPNAPFYHKTFGLWMCLDTWHENGLPRDIDLNEFFLFDVSGIHTLGQLGWESGEFFPRFEEKQIEDKGDHEIIQDEFGRQKLVFKGRRQGYMPEYVGHPVKDLKSWQENVKWRLDPKSPERYHDFDIRMNKAKADEQNEVLIRQNLVGGYMFLRSLMGPEDIMYVFYDKPALVHDCMETWLYLADKVIEKHQEHVTLDEIFMAEDICYNHGPLVSPDMIKEFLFPYYQQLINNVRSRQKDKDKHLYIQIDTDGKCDSVIELYKDGIGMEVMTPFEVASGSNVVEIGQKYPWLIIYGGIDKRILAKDTDTIDRYLEKILPVMRKRGGYIPTCDHGVPPEVTWQNYLHYRKRCIEYGS